MLRPGEFKAVSIWAALLVAIILLPYPFATIFAGPGWHFMGHLHAVDEGNAYLAWSRQAAEGAWRLRNMYTATPDKGLFFNAFFVAIGKTAALLHVEPVVVFHLARPICGWVCLVSIYLLAAFVFPDSLTRWAAFALAALSSGVGWFVHLFRGPTGLHPLDFGEGLIQPEAITFLCIYVNPLFAASLALMCLVFVTFLSAVHSNRHGWIIAAGLLNLLLGNIHTYDVLVVNGALAVYLLLLLGSRAISLWPALWSYGIFLGISAASPIYQAYVVAADPLYAAKAATVTASLRPVDHALTYGFVLIFALAGAAYIARRPDSRTVFLLAWLVIGALMPLAPADDFPFQRKMWEGYHVVLSLLGAVACTHVILPWLARKRPPTSAEGRARFGMGLIAAAVALTVPSNLFFVNLTMRDAADNNTRLVKNLMPPMYLSNDDIRALHWLRDNTSRDDVVFSAPYVGSHIPAVSGNRVYMGHWAETLGFGRLAGVVEQFYSARISPAECEQILRRARARYVYYGAYERLIGEPNKPRFMHARNLTPAFAAGDVTIYRVTDAPGRAGR